MIKDNQNTFNKLHILADAAFILAAYYLAYPLRFIWLPAHGLFTLAPNVQYLSFSEYAENIFYIVPGYLLIYYLVGLYRPKRSHSIIRVLASLAEANILGIFYFAFLLYIQKQQDISRIFYIVFLGLTFSFCGAFRIVIMKVLRIFRKRGLNIKHVLMVGYSRAAEGFIDRIANNPDWGYQIHGILDDNMAVGTKYRHIAVLGTTSELEQFIADNDFDEIVISLGLPEYDILESIAAICEKSGLHTKFVPDYNNIVSTVPYIEDLYGLPVINIRNVPLSNTFNILIKRLGDILLGTVALIIFAIPMLITALIVKLSSPGPVIYKQTRVGLHGREFKMFKFRSMYMEDSGSEKSKWTKKGDSRITPFGRFIRKTSIDELPQLFNVLGGSMSLVGPRPERPQFVEKFREEIPRYMVKHQVRPGMTGWAQINGFRGDTSIRKRIDHDLYYIENWSLILDIKILFLTIFKGFINKNAY